MVSYSLSSSFKVNILAISECKQTKWNSSSFLCKTLRKAIIEDCNRNLSIIINYTEPLIHYPQSMKKEAAIIRLVISCILTDFRQLIWVSQVSQSRIKPMTRKRIGSWDSFKRIITIYRNKMTVWFVQFIKLSS